MNWIIIICIVLAALVLLAVACVIAFLLLLAIFYVFAVKGRRNHKGMEQLKTWKYAHRGLHDGEKPENSMAAFEDRCTDSTGTVEDMTVAQLQQCHLGGTQEVIPTFRQVLELFDGKAPMIIELKSTGKNYAELTDRVMEELKDYSGAYCLESFDPNCLKHLKKNYPDEIRGQLADNYLKNKVNHPFYLRFAMTYMLANFMFQPDFIAYRFEYRKTLSNFLIRKLWKMYIVSWTLKNQENYDTAVSEGWIPIFEGFEP